MMPPLLALMAAAVAIEVLARVAGLPALAPTGFIAFVWQNLLPIPTIPHTKRK
jgi:hypothetical protein